MHATARVIRDKSYDLDPEIVDLGAPNKIVGTRSTGSGSACRENKNFLSSHFYFPFILPRRIQGNASDSNDSILHQRILVDLVRLFQYDATHALC